MTTYLRDGNPHNSRTDVEYPLDWEEVSNYRIQPVLVIEFTPDETREILAALESTRKGRHNDADVRLDVYLSHTTYMYTLRNQPNPFYSHNLEAGCFRARPSHPYDDGVRETLPDEWVSFERKTYGNSPYGYWQATHRLSILDQPENYKFLYGAMA